MSTCWPANVVAVPTSVSLSETSQLPASASASWVKPLLAPWRYLRPPAAETTHLITLSTSLPHPTSFIDQASLEA